MISQEDIKSFTEQVRLSRKRLLVHYPFFGMLMMNVRFALDDTIETAATNGSVILFDPAFSLTDREMDFVLMHELMHIALDHLARSKNYNTVLFNVAADIVVNSSIMKTIGEETFIVDGEEVMHTLPDGSEGYLYSAEEVYHKLVSEGASGDSYRQGIDRHGLWGEMTDARRQEIRQIVEETAAAVSKMHGSVPDSIQRTIGQRRSAKLDWRQVLAEFVQEDILDYSFEYPDKRYSGDFILPDLTAIDGEVRNILFMIDTSGSMSEWEITEGYSELCGAIEQFGGRLSGMLGFFDSAVTPPVPFESVSDVMEIKPIGGGGTSVDIIFDYVAKHMQEEPPVSIIILTDGWVDFPEKDPTGGIPVLWLITSEWGDAPNWGNVVYLNGKGEDEDIDDIIDEELPF